MDQENNQYGTMDEPIKQEIDNVPQSERRTILGEDGMIATCFAMLFFPFRKAIRFIASLFNGGWFYNLIKFSYSNNGFPFIAEAFGTLTCNMLDSRSRDLCFKLCCCCAPFAIYMFFMCILCYIVDLVIGIFQLAFGIITLPFTILSRLIYKTEGLHPVLISVLHIWRAISRITLIPAIFIPCCADIKDYINEKDAPTYTRLTWEDYMNLLVSINIFSLNRFLIDENDLDKILLLIPIINVPLGIFHLILGIITFPFTLIITIFFKTKSISWLEWSGIHILKGALGTTIVTPHIYYFVFYDSHLKAIRRRCGIPEDATDEDICKVLSSYDSKARTFSEFIKYVVMFIKELNPYSMKFLYVKDGKMNAMDWMAIIPIIGFIPALFRIPTAVIWLTCGCGHNLCYKRLNRPSYFKIFGIYVGTGLLAGSIFFTWINYIIYLRREKIVKDDQRENAESYQFTV
jgi:hypothetical protein